MANSLQATGPMVFSDLELFIDWLESDWSVCLERMACLFQGDAANRKTLEMKQVWNLWTGLWWSSKCIRVVGIDHAHCTCDYHVELDEYRTNCSNTLYHTLQTVLVCHYPLPRLWTRSHLINSVFHKDQSLDLYSLLFTQLFPLSMKSSSQLLSFTTHTLMTLNSRNLRPLIKSQISSFS